LIRFEMRVNSKATAIESTGKLLDILTSVKISKRVGEVSEYHFQLEPRIHHLHFCGDPLGEQEITCLVIK